VVGPVTTSGIAMAGKRKIALLETSGGLEHVNVGNSH